jgi:hypothetical protein
MQKQEVMQCESSKHLLQIGELHKFQQHIWNALVCIDFIDTYNIYSA